MRILHILPSLNAVTGGPSRSIPLQLKGLARLGHSVELFTTNWPDETHRSMDQSFEVDGVTVRLFRSTPIWPLRHVPYSRQLVAAVRESRGQYDVYHVSSIWNPLAAHTMAVLRRMGLPYVLTCHGMLDPLVFERHRAAKRAWAWFWERKNVESAAMVHFMSAREAEKAQEKGWRLRKTLVMPVNIDVDAWADLPSPGRFEAVYPHLEGKEVVLFVGRLSWVKNLDLLVEAIARLRAQGRNVALVCVGPDTEGSRARLEHLASSQGVGDCIAFTGLLVGEALREAYARANVVALVSRKENFGIAAADALSAGVPVVLSDGVDMGKGWLAPPAWRVTQDAESIARGLAEALAYSSQQDRPCAIATELAKREWGNPPVGLLADALESVSVEHATRKAGR